jgi:hypothetical protein
MRCAAIVLATALLGRSLAVAQVPPDAPPPSDAAAADSSAGPPGSVDGSSAGAPGVVDGTSGGAPAPGAAAAVPPAPVAAAPAEPAPADEPPPPPPPPDTPPALERPVLERPRSASQLRHALHLGAAFGLEVARDGDGAYALGAGAQLGWELYWPRFAIELAVAIAAHGDQATSPNEGFWEAHPMAYLKLPFGDGVWEMFGGYGASLPSFHDGDLAPATSYHVLELGFEDRTRSWYSRLYVRLYAPFDGSLSAPTAIVGATVGLFHLSQSRAEP